MRFIGGWMKITAGKETIRLTAVIKNIGDLLMELRRALEAKGKGDCMDPRKFYSFLKTAVYVDQSWERFYDYFGRMVLVGCGLGVMVLFLGWILNMGLQRVIIWVTCSLIWYLILFLIDEIAYIRHFARGADQRTCTFPSRDKEREKYIFANTSLWGIMGFMGVSLILIVTLGYYG